MVLSGEELRVAVPSKGRLMDKSLELLKGAGLRFRVTGRRLFARCKDTGVLVIFSNAQDIPGLVDEGVVDLGITGSDLVVEKQAGVRELQKLGFGRCRLSFASHVDSECIKAEDFSGKIIGTKFVNTARKFFQDRAVENVHIIEINGAVEVMVLLGLVDGILDVVETGSSLREHDLVERITVLEAEAVLIAAKNPRDPVMLELLSRRIEGVLTASRYSLLEYNCPAEKIEEAKAITPGFSSPTIQGTDNEAWLAVKVMVEKKKTQSAMDALEKLGCRAILETAVHNCRL